MSESSPQPSARMRALYQHHCKIRGEPEHLIWFDGAQAHKPVHLDRLYVCAWPANDDRDVTTFMTLGMSEAEMPGDGVRRAELHLAMRAELEHNGIHQVARFLANLAEYPFDHNLQLDWWHRIQDAGRIPFFPGQRHLLLRPPFLEDGCDVVIYDEEPIRFLYVVPLTGIENQILADHGVDAYLEYLVDNDLDPLGNREIDEDGFHKDEGD